MDSDVGDWHAYLVEAFYRVDPTWKDDYPQTEVLGVKDNKHYKQEIDSLRESLTKPLGGDDALIMLSSPDPKNLVHVLSDITASLPPNRLPKARIYVAVPAPLLGAAARAIQRTGATFMPLDTTKSIPQRPERLARYLADRAEDDEQ